MTTALWITIAVSTLGAGGLASLATFFTIRPQREKISAEAKKLKADAADVITDQALALIGPLHQEIERLQGRLLNALTQVEELTRNLDEAHVRETIHLKRIKELEDENATMRAFRKNYEE